MSWQRRTGPQIWVTREEMFERVWSQPLKEVADHYDCEYQQLRGACQKSRIPLPAAGHWMKVRAGKSVAARPQLPKPSNPNSRVLLIAGQRERRHEQALRATRREAYRREFAQVLATDQRRPSHPAILQLRRERKDGYGIANPQQRAVHLSPLTEAGDRAFEIANTIATVLAKRGFDISPAALGSIELWAPDLRLKVRVRERLRQVKTRVDKSKMSELSRLLRGDWKVEFAPTGVVECEIDGTRWVGKPGQAVEAALPDILAEILCRRDEAGALAAKQSADLERQKRADLAHERRRIEDEHENETWTKLTSLADQRSQAQRVRELLAALEAIPLDISELPPGLTKDGWLAEMARLASKRDPLARGLAAIIRAIPLAANEGSRRAE